MSPNDLTQYLQKNVPLSKAMQVSATEVTPERVVLVAPLEPNINHHGIVFGGSAATLAVLAAWSLLHTRLETDGVACKLVVHGSKMDYDAPMDGQFMATATSPDPAEWEHFIHTFRSKGKARVRVKSVLTCSGRQAARFQGDFVALQGAGA